MPAIPRHPCRHSGCSNLTDASVCADHASDDPVRLYDQTRRDDPARIYDSRRWRRLREIVLARDLLCVLCHQQPSSDADHIIPVRQGGEPWSLENLEGLCSACHSKKTRREAMLPGKG